MLFPIYNSDNLIFTVLISASLRSLQCESPSYTHIKTVGKIMVWVFLLGAGRGVEVMTS
jgi:hypothetical protein